MTDRIRDNRGEIIPPKGGSSTAPAIPIIPDWYICEKCEAANEWNAHSAIDSRGKICRHCGSDYLRKARVGRDVAAVKKEMAGQKPSGKSVIQQGNPNGGWENFAPKPCEHIPPVLPSGLIDLGNGVAVNPANVSMVQLVTPELAHAYELSLQWHVFVFTNDKRYECPMPSESEARAAYAKLTQPRPHPIACKYWMTSTEQK